MGYVYKYDCDARRLTDVLRASFIFKDIESLRRGAELIHEEFEATGGILNIEDRIAEPTPAGYRDVLLNVKFQNVVVELQLHLEPFYNLKKENELQLQEEEEEKEEEEDESQLQEEEKEEEKEENESQLIQEEETAPKKEGTIRKALRKVGT